MSESLRIGGFPGRCFDTCETPGDCLMGGCKKGYKDEEAPLSTDRLIEFNIAGDIIVMSDTSKEIVERGVVLIPARLVVEAAKYGWREDVSDANEVALGLVRVRRG